VSAAPEHRRAATIARIAPVLLYTIYDSPWGFREFGVQDPDGYDIGFGQPLGG
jgi:hypothetical protein